MVSGRDGHLGSLSQPSHLQMPYAGASSGYSNLVSMGHTPSNINTIHTVKMPESKEFEIMKQEKNALHSKLDDF
jgi:hypothetical protein